MIKNLVKRHHELTTADQILADFGEPFQAAVYLWKHGWSMQACCHYATRHRVCNDHRMERFSG
jgi:hypothetical protein